jgi:hypothetical protein
VGAELSGRLNSCVSPGELAHRRGELVVRERKRQASGTILLWARSQGQFLYGDLSIGLVIGLARSSARRSVVSCWPCGVLV